LASRSALRRWDRGKPGEKSSFFAESAKVRLTNVNFENQVVLALELLTHAEYEKDKWKGRY